MLTSTVDSSTVTTTAPAFDWCTALEHAILAPSSHNTQPWRFRVREGGVDLFIDRTRRLPVADPDDRELTMSCGAALLHLRLALRVSGVESVVTLLPDSTNSDFLARVERGNATVPSDEDCQLVDAIPYRHTNRQQYTGRSLPAGVTRRLLDAACTEGAWLLPVGGNRREAVIDLIAEAGRRQWADRAFRRELAHWIRPHRANDGLPGYAFGLGPLIVRTFDMGVNQARREHDLAAEAPVLAVLGTLEDNPLAWLEAGQAVARVLLTATMHSIACAFHNQPMQVSELRPQVMSALGTSGYPQLLLRMGYAPETHAAPRRPVHEVLVN
jgi:nitroreductase